MLRIDPKERISFSELHKQAIDNWDIFTNVDLKLYEKINFL